MIVAKRYLISGRVQGVGFRYYLQDHAAVEGVHGYVRNLSDGRHQRAGGWSHSDEKRCNNSIPDIQKWRGRRPGGWGCN